MQARATPESVDVQGSLSHAPGGGMMKNETAPYTVQSVGRQFIDMKAPQNSVVDLVRNLPSMNVATENTSGVTGAATGTAEIRGLTDADMTILVNGGPTAGFGYVNETIDSEDIDTISVMPGGGAVELPASTSAGGVMKVVTHTPSEHFAAKTDFSYGTNNMSREFARVETGNIKNSGVRSYMSFSNTHARSWMGAGINSRYNVDIGVEKNFSNGSWFKLFGSWDRTDAMESVYPTAAQFYTYKHTGTGYGRSGAFDPSNNNFWKDNITHWDQFTFSSPTHIVLSPIFSLDFNPYLYSGMGYTTGGAGLGYASDGYVTSSGASIADNSPLTGYFKQNNWLDIGTTIAVNARLGSHHTISLGYWFDHNDQTYSLPMSLTRADGSAANPDNRNYKLYYPNGLPVNEYTHGGYELNAIFIKDSAKYLHDRLTIDGGFKFVMTRYWYHDRYSTSDGWQGTNLGLNSTAPLPQLSIGYKINPAHQIYFNAEGDFRQPSPTNLSVNPDTNKLPNNQYVIKEELGYRYQGSLASVDLSLFNYSITNRLLTTYVADGQSVTMNAGNQTSRGVDIMVSGRPIYGFSPYASVEYLDATQDSNIPLEGSYIQTKGHRAVMAPKVMANFGLTYRYKGFFVNGTIHYASSQYTTLARDEKMPGYVTDTLTLGYKIPPFMFVKGSTFTLNFTNLTGSIIRTGVTGVTTNAAQVRLMNGQMSSADTVSPNTYLVEPRFSMTGSLSIDL